MDADGFAEYSGIRIASSNKALQDLQMRCFYTALLEPFFKFEIA